MQIKYSLFILLFSLMFFACDEPRSLAFVKVEDGRFMTPENQELFLKAINVVNKRKEDNFVPHYTADVYQKIRDNGYNSIRLGINWSALEPQPLKYNEEYLQQLDSQIMLIKEQGLYIILDMHQDLYGIKFDGGAPLWATLDEGKEHTTGEVWSEAYYLSAAVQTAFDNFWDNKIVEESGLAIQVHYARLWKFLAERYADETSIVGFDIMNEPFAGSDGPKAMLAMFTKLAEIDDDYNTVEQIKKGLSNTESKSELLAKLSDLAIYESFMTASESIYKTFEEKKLQVFYQHIADSIRRVDCEHILFLEPSVSANNGAQSIIAPTKLESGEKDKQVAFAAHLYDIVLDTDLAFTASGDRLDFILSQIMKSAKQHNMPIFIGEWGAFYGSANCSPVAEHYIKMFETNGVSNAYWDYTSDIWELPHFEKMHTIYPQKIGGKLISVTNTKNTSIIKWLPNNKSETIIYVPSVEKISSVVGDDISHKITIYPDSKSGFITVEGKTINKELEIIINFK